ncbi:tetratricopeptide repeat protein [Phenylobacterium aquaticum]|uniref:tetratricopeptide repeat protein n=1 Tax=Phenylobacterium aquaticum TaxID=1763816 RepID=UPI0026EDB4BB|nr:tetratricopeptide repeat protein [Phenylobacterium aquaticum]
MAHLDRGGLPLSTGSDVAAARYREGVDLMLAAWTGSTEALDRAIAADPDFALAIAARARAHTLASEPAKARAAIDQAERLVTQAGTDRERSHVEVLALATRGDAKSALERALVHLDAWPRDAFILSLPLGAFGLFAFSGMADHTQAGVDLCERVAAHYGTDWWFLTALGWSHTENTNVAHGRRLTEQGLALRPDNAHAVHGLAHALFEQGAGQEADALITAWLPGYDRSGLLHGHISWHQALVALEAGDVERALGLYTRGVRPATSAAMPINIVSDCASFLWRVDAYGQAAPRPLWDELADYAMTVFPNGGFAFIDVHMAMIAAANGDAAGLEKRIETVNQHLASGRFPAGPVVPAICRALPAFAQGDYGRCAALLEPVAQDVVRIGGSHAQREVIEDTLLQAWLRSGETAKGRALLDARLHRRPSLRDEQWRAGLAA